MFMQKQKKKSCKNLKNTETQIKKVATPNLPQVKNLV